MPEKIHCPSCRAALQATPEVLGRTVRCSNCQTTFTAEMEPPSPPQGIVREAPPRQPFHVSERQGPAWEDEDHPRWLRRDSNVHADVSGPATALIVVAAIDLFLGVLRFVAPVLGVSLDLAGSGRSTAFAGNSDLAAGVGFSVILGILHFVFGGTILAGAIKMKRVQNYEFARTACILAMIPCFNCCLLGLPFGIWGLNVLSRPEVRAAFTQPPFDSMDEMS